MGRKIKEQLYEQFARIGKALDSPQRLELLDLLSQCERMVEELAIEAHLTIANTSRHLQILRQAQLVENRKEGVKVFYRLKNDEVYHLFHSLRKLAEVNLAEVSQIMNQYFYAPDQFQAVNRQELITRAQKREVIILDVRPAIEFEVAHLPHAKSIPLKELQNRLAELPKEQEIVAYCRGPYCVLAQEAVIFLRSQGFQAVRMPEGVHEWAEAGLITRN